MPDPTAKSASLAALFTPHLAGDVLYGERIPAEYGRDASPYRRIPAVVIRPLDRDDIVATIRIAAARGIALVPRAAGTSLAGQCVGIGDFVVLDIGACQHHIVDLDVGMRLVTVQPGIVRDVLNRQLGAHGLLFAPDPSTTDRCQIGGMIGNNAWGLHAVGRGTTRDHVAELEVVMADGSVQQLAGISTQALQALRAAADRGSVLHTAVHDTVQRHVDVIDQGFPSLRGITNNAGYPLDVIRQQQPFNPQGPLFNLAPLLCGAEGTLAIVTKARLRLIERPRATQLCCIGFQSIDAALGAVAAIHATAPAALELLDRGILRVAASDAEQAANRFWLRGDPAAVLLVEYAGADADDVGRRVGELQRHYGVTARTIVEGEQIEQVWALRRAALKMLMGAEGGLRALTGIEDAAVSVAHLPMFYREVGELLARDGLAHFAYGPVGMGSLHIRPELPLDGADAIDRYQRLLDQVAAIAVRLRGTFSCKHGDGRMRGRYLDAVLGSEVVDALRAVKRIFDPAGVLNPGKILDCPPFAEDLALPGML